MTLRFHGHPLSSYCWKALIALHEAELPFEFVMINLGDPAEVEQVLKSKKGIRGVAVTHSDTATGVLNDVAATAKIARKYDVLMLVDAVSSLGGLPFKFDGLLNPRVDCGANRNGTTVFQRGALVTAIRPGVPAETAGMAVGTAIVAVDSDGYLYLFANTALTNASGNPVNVVLLKKFQQP